MTALRVICARGRRLISLLGIGGLRRPLQQNQEHRQTSILQMSALLPVLHLLEFILALRSALFSHYKFQMAASRNQLSQVQLRITEVNTHECSADKARRRYGRCTCWLSNFFCVYVCVVSFGCSQFKHLSARQSPRSTIQSCARYFESVYRSRAEVHCGRIKSALQGRSDEGLRRLPARAIVRLIYGLTLTRASVDFRQRRVPIMAIS